MTSFNGSGGFGGDFFAGYKHLYNPRRVAVLAYEKRYLLKTLAKRDEFTGDTYNHSIFYEDPQGGSSNQQVAINQKQQSSQGARFVLNRGREYQVISILNEEIRASRDDMGSLLRKKKHETDRVINEMSRRVDIACHGAGNGVLASFTTTTSVNTTTLFLDTPALGIRFSDRMVLQCVTTNNTNGTPNTFANGGNVARVVAISRAGTQTQLTLDQTLSAAWGLATSTQYWLCRNGDNIGFSINNPSGGVAGLKSWLPVTAPVSGDSFWGFDRSIDAQRLSGTRYVAPLNGERYEATFQNASAELALQEANPTIILANPIDCNKYSQELGNKVRYDEADPGSTGFRPLLVRGQSGDMKLVPDAQVDPGLFYMLDMDTWWLLHLDGVPHIVEDDGRPALREATSDAIEIRWRAWYQPVCDAPGHNLVGMFAP